MTVSSMLVSLFLFTGFVYAYSSNDSNLHDNQDKTYTHERGYPNNLLTKNSMAIICPAPVSVNAPPDACEVFVNIPLPTSDDPNCPLTVITNDLTGGADPSGIYPVSDLIITWTVEDACGAMATCPQIISIDDASIAEFECPVGLFATCGVSEHPPYASLAEFLAAGGMASDGCGLDIPTFNLLSEMSDGMTCPETVTREYMLMDMNGNDVSCTQDVTIWDLTMPTFTVPVDVTIDCNDDPTNLLLTGDVDDESDNCSSGLAAGFNDVSAAGNCPGETIITRTWSLVDDCSNVNNQDQLITVSDISAPTVICQDITVMLDINGEATINADELDGGSTDACGSTLSFSADITIFFCNDLSGGPVNVVLTVTDACGNDDTCMVMVTIEDPIMPMLTCPADMTAECDITELPPFATLDELLGAGGIYDDNCPHDPASFGLMSELSDAGSCPEVVTRVYTVSDLAGNVATCQHSIVIDDFTSPVVICPADITMAGNPTTCLATVTVPPVITSESCGIQSVVNDYTGMDNASGDYPVGVTEILWTVTDLCGNVGTCMMEVQVLDSGPPVLTCPADLTATCDISEQPPYATFMEFETDGGTYNDNCSLDPSSFALFSETSDAMTCPETVTRVYIVTDESGNTGTCSQLIVIDDNINPTFDALPPPLADIDCDDSFPAQIALTASDNCSGPVVVTPSVDPFNVNICSGYSVTFRWTATDVCGNSVDITRTFTVLRDSEIPMVSCNDVTVDTDPSVCVTNTTPLPPTITDNCSSWSMTNSYNGTDDATDEYPIGTTPITWTVTDDCGNINTCEQLVTVEDNEGPDIVCDPDQCVVLGGSGTGLIQAINLIISATDNCNTLGSHEVGRVNAGPCGIANDTDFGPSVEFCCADAGQDIMVEVIVYDGAGNSTTCMVRVAVKDNTPPTIVTCPTDITVSCEFPVDTSDLSGFGTIVFDIADINDITVNDEVYDPTFIAGQDGFATDNCMDGLTLSESVSGTLTCNQGTFSRVFTVTDASGNSSSCTQAITIMDLHPFLESDITWPPDIVLDLCPDTDVTEIMSGFPMYTEGPCDLVSHKFDDLVFDNPNSGCQFIRRTWEVLDWCQYIPNDPQSPGIWYHTQNITLENHINPQFVTGCTDTVICANEVTCDGDVVLMVTANDDCTDSLDLMFWWEVDLDADGSIDDNGNGNILTGTYPRGDHEVTWFVEDRCGNDTMCTIAMTIRDCKAPTAVCYNGLAIPLMQMDMGAMIEIWAEDFNRYSSDNCTADEDLTFAFGSGGSPQNMIFTCDDLDEQVVEMWVTDEAGNESHCVTYVDVQDMDSICPPMTMANIRGTLYTEDFNILSETEVNIESGEMSDYYMSDESGDFAFMEIPMHQDYDVTPFKDGDFLNGVTTLDLLLIQKHILGLDKLVSPYKIIAADIHANEKISGVDLIELRKLILGIYDELPNNRSWRFVKSDFEFEVPEEPWPFEEIASYEDLDENKIADFIGVKIGDVNNSVDLFQGQQVESRSSATIVADDVTYEAGDVVRIELFIQGKKLLTGMQMGLHLRDMELLDIEPGALDIEEYNYSVTQNEDLLINISWNNIHGEAVPKPSSLFTLILKSRKDGFLSDVMRLDNSVINAEMYGESLVPEDIHLRVGTEVNELLSHTNPNPFKDRTTIFITSEREESIILQLHDVSGRLLYETDMELHSGMNEVIIDKEKVKSHSGIIIYTLKGNTMHHYGKLIRVK